MGGHLDDKAYATVLSLGSVGVGVFPLHYSLTSLVFILAAMGRPTTGCVFIAKESDSRPEYE